MKPLNSTVIAIGLLVSFLLPLSAQDTKEKYDIAECKTMEEINQAKARGAEFLFIRGTYFVRIGNEYKGPFRNLDQALKERSKHASGASGKNVPERDSGYYNPLTVIYPFTEPGDAKTFKFKVPSGELVPASKVMIHGEPFAFDKVSFGPINLRQKGYYFAVTGKAFAKANIHMATEGLKYSVGAAVIDGNGKTLWKNYGKVEADMGFRAIAPLENPKATPQFLLVFLIAEGKLAKQVSVFQPAAAIDASSYDYHILCSLSLDIASNWFPPMEDVIKEEYTNLLREENKGKQFHFGQSPKSPSKK